MQAKDVLCTDTAVEGRRDAWLRLCVSTGLLACTGSLFAQPLPASMPLITPSEQAARDTDRIDILRQELKKSEEQLAILVRRHAQRLTPADMQAAAETEDQRVRLLGDIAGLQREIASTSRSAGRASPAKPGTGPGARHRAIAGWNEAAAPWWDVYSSSRNTRLSTAPLAAPTSAQASPTRSHPSAGVTP